MDNSITLSKTENGICAFIACLFDDLGIPANEQIILWKMVKDTISCKELMYYLSKVKEVIKK